MTIWSAEIKDLQSLFESVKGRFPDLEKELGRLIKADDENMVLLYSRRSLEVIITDLCEYELKRPRGTEPLKGIIDKLNKENKVPYNIIASMHSLNTLSTFGTHPKEYEPEQVKPVLNNLDTVIKWYQKYKDLQIAGKSEETSPKHLTGQKTHSPPEKSVIVLPFVNMSPDPDQEYFSDGLTEEIITDLSHIHDLLVISRSSAMTFKGTKKKIREIAGDVYVRYVLEGSVRKAGNNLRITAQLIDALTDSHIWAEKYNGTLDDVFDIQEKVSRSIANALKLKLTPEENLKIAENPIPDVFAYECFIKARYEIWKSTEENLDQALIYLEKGLEMIGENPVLLAGIGYVYFQYFNFGYKTDDIILQNAEEYANHALDIDPESAPANIVLANLRGWNKHPKEAIRLLKIALKSEPNNFDALIWISSFCSYLGKSRSAKSYVERLLNIEPMHHMSHVTYSIVKLGDGDFSGALNSIRRAYELYPKELIVQWVYAYILIYRLSIDDALEVLGIILNSYPDYVPGKLLYSQILGMQDKKLEALKILNDPEIINWARHDFSFSLLMTESYTILNRKEDALSWLELSIELGFNNFPFLNEHNSLLKGIRDEKRFKKLMERVKHEWENFEV